MLDLTTIEADPEKLRDGVWYEIWRLPDTSIAGKPVPGNEPPDGKACVLVVPLGLAYERAFDKEREPHREEIRGGHATEELLNAIAGRTLGRVVLRGWTNIGKGTEEIVYSEKAAIDLMTDQRWIRLREFVESAARDRSGARAHEEEQAKGN